MKKLLTVTAFAALAFAACGGSGSDSIPTTGNPDDALFGSPWVATTSSNERHEVVQFERISPNSKIYKMTKYVTCTNNRYSTVQADIALGDKGIEINKDYKGTNDDDCQARIDKGNYGYTVTPSLLKMVSTGEEKKELTYKREGVYSCLMSDYFNKGQTCADYYNDTIPQSACANLPNSKNAVASVTACQNRVSKIPQQVCRVNATLGNGKVIDLVLNFYDNKADCKLFGAGLVAQYNAQLVD